MRILFSTGSPAGYMAPPSLSDDQINCGPDWADQKIDERWISLATPRGEYDLKHVVERLPPNQRPDAVVCLVDATLNNCPRNLQALHLPKILLVADTHHCVGPLTALLRYAASERYDRIVLLYDRHHFEFFQAAGFAQLFWFPGLTFPHRNAEVAQANQVKRAPQLAFVGQVGKHHPRRKRLLAALTERQLPLAAKALNQKDALGFYGSSLLGFNASLNGDLNLRVFEIMASGAMLLTDRLAAASGLTELWTEGRDLATYSSIDELVEKTRHFLSHPAEASVIGRAGAQWIAQHFSEKQRRQAFFELVVNGRAQPAFALPPTRKLFLGAGDQAWCTFTGVYERIQELHRSEETVRIDADTTVPEDLIHLFQTLPRVQISRSAMDSNSAIALSIVGRERLKDTFSETVQSLWCWNSQSNDADSSAAKFASAQMPLVSREPLLFARVQNSAAALGSKSSQARLKLEQGDYQNAFACAKAALDEEAQPLEAFLVMADLALEMSNRDLFSKMVLAARRIAPTDLRIAELAGSVANGPRKSQLPSRLLKCAQAHFLEKQYREALTGAERARQADPQSPDPFLLIGRCLLAIGEKPKGLEALRTATRLGSKRTDCWNALGLAARDAGLLDEANAAFAQNVQLDPERAEYYILLGETHLGLGQVDKAAQAFETVLTKEPQNRIAMLWLGHARKRQGQLGEALVWHRRACGAVSFSKNVSRSKRRRVVFAVQHGPSWTSNASVYAAFAADPNWEATVVAIPYQHPYYKTEEQTHAIFDFLKKEAIPHVRWDEFSLEAYAPDVLFLQNPYDVTRPPAWRVFELLKVVARIAYVPYALEINGSEESAANQWGQPLQQCAWAVFARSQRHKAMFAQRCLCGDAHVTVTGHPKMDGMRELAAQRDPRLQQFIAGRKMVLWNPHFDVRPNGTPFGCGYSTFLRWHEFMVSEFARRQSIAFVVRPHPLFFSALQTRGILSAAQIQEFLDRCAAAGNILIDREPSFLPVFAAADALVSDASSFIFEFAATRKPILYLHNPHGHGLNSDGDFVHRYCATAEDETAISRFLDDVVAGKDERREARTTAFREIMYIPEEGVGLTIKRAVDTRLAEEIRPAEIGRPPSPLACSTPSLSHEYS